MTKSTATSAATTVLLADATTAISPLLLCEHLIQVAQEADRAGYAQTASHLVQALERMFDTAPQTH